MFSLAIIKDTLAIQPSYFSIAPEKAIKQELNKKYANKVLHDVGLGICVFDIVKVGEGKVRYGDGCYWYQVTFRLVVFRPFASEVIIAKIKSSSEDGIRLSIGFFDDLYVPLTYLPQPSAFDPNEQAYFWLPESELTSTAEMLDTPLTSRMYIDRNEVVRVRVESDEFFDDEPGPPKAADGVIVQRELRRSPFQITCSIAEQGLGPLSWWDGSAEQAEEQEMEEG
ncbi:polymerase III polypeptide H [Gautieria morchelliformis]|nr:polymerase III polypeptide H [Gautieria morchelliformis]